MGKNLSWFVLVLTVMLAGCAGDGSEENKKETPPPPAAEKREKRQDRENESLRKKLLERPERPGISLSLSDVERAELERGMAGENIRDDSFRKRSKRSSDWVFGW